MSVVKIDDAVIGNGAPGPITQQIRARVYGDAGFDLKEQGFNTKKGDAQPERPPFALLAEVVNE